MGKKRHEDEDDAESLGSDLEQMVAMLEKAEIDYEKTEDTDDGDDETMLVINDESYATFDEDGNLIGMGAKF